MKVLRRIAATLAICGAASAAHAQELPFLTNAAGHKAPFTIGVSNGYVGNAWRAQFLADFEKVATKLKAGGTVKDVIIVSSTSGANGQISQINSLLSRGVDAIVVAPVSADALKPVIARAIAAGVLVVCTDNPMDLATSLNVTQDQTQFSTIEADWMVDTLGGKGNVVAIDGLAGSTTNDWRNRTRDGVLAQHPDVKLVGSAPGQWDQATAREAMTGLLAAHSDIDGVISQEVMPEGVLRAFAAAERPLVPLTGDYVHSYLKTWSATPELKSIVVANPPSIGADTLQITAELLGGKTLNPGVLVGNPLNANERNTILVKEPFVIERQANTSRPWCTPETKCISLPDALAMLDGQSDASAIDTATSADDVIKRYFK